MFMFRYCCSFLTVTASSFESRGAKALRYDPYDSRDAGEEDPRSFSGHSMIPVSTGENIFLQKRERAKEGLEDERLKS